MKTCTLNCTIISPMFSYGNQRAAELRPSELKGLMRYMFRAAILESEQRNCISWSLNILATLKKMLLPFGCSSNHQRCRQLAKNFCCIEQKKRKISSSVSRATPPLSL